MTYNPTKLRKEGSGHYANDMVDTVDYDKRGNLWEIRFSDGDTLLVETLGDARDLIEVR